MKKRRLLNEIRFASRNRVSLKEEKKLENMIIVDKVRARGGHYEAQHQPIWIRGSEPAVNAASRVSWMSDKSEVVQSSQTLMQQHQRQICHHGRRKECAGEEEVGKRSVKGSERTNKTPCCCCS